MNTILVGVDSGGTRTNVSIDINGERRSYETNRSLSGSPSPSEYPNVLRAILAPIEGHLLDASAESPLAIFISAAGFTPAFREEFLEAAHEVVSGLVSGRVACVGIANDAPTLILGHDADAVVIAGTGSNVLIRSIDGTLYQVGRHKWVVSDYSSGFWIGLRAIRRAYRDHEADTPSVLLQRLMESYGVREGDDRRLIAKLRDLAIADSSLKPEFARFAAPVCSAAERGDGPSQDIVKQEAEDLADVLSSALRRRFTQDQLGDGIRIVECGGLLSNGFYRDAFRAQAEMRLRTGGRPAVVEWSPVATGAQAALNLPGRVASGSWTWPRSPPRSARWFSA